MSEQMEQFVTFFKALADANRLKIVGLLAHKPHSVEELAANLGVSSATISHHLQRLQQANLVEARVQQYYNMYSLRQDTWQHMIAQLASTDALKAATPIVRLDGYATQVLDEYLVRGRLKTIPSQFKKREVVLCRLAQEFEIGKRYPEKRVNAMLKAFHADYTTLRDEMVKLKLLGCARGYYWRVTDENPST